MRQTGSERDGGEGGSEREGRREGVIERERGRE